MKLCCDVCLQLCFLLIVRLKGALVPMILHSYCCDKLSASVIDIGQEFVGTVTTSNHIIKQ
jgi:hypothetical protein